MRARRRADEEVGRYGEGPASSRGSAQDRARQAGLSLPGLAGLQRTAGNQAVGRLLAPAVPVQRCGCGGAHGHTVEPPVQRLGFGFLGDLVSAAGDLLGGDEAEPLQQKPAATCSEPPNWEPEKSIPVDILADTALEFSQKIKAALGGNPHMQPGFSWNPDVDDKGRITKLNMKITTKIVRPRWAGGRPTEQEKILITKLEGLIKAHEERHRDIARRFAQRAVCAAIGKTGNDYEKAVKAVLCEMNKAQEVLDHTEGTNSWTLDPAGGRVIDVKLAPEPTASYPCT